MVTGKLLKPVAPGGSETGLQCKLLVLTHSAVDPGGGIAETLTNVVAPEAGPVVAILDAQTLLSGFGGPAEFTRGSAGEFIFNERLPLQTGGIA